MTVIVTSLATSDIGAVTLGKEYDVIEVDDMRRGLFIRNDDGEEWFMYKDQVEFVD